MKTWQRMSVSFGLASAVFAAGFGFLWALATHPGAVAIGVLGAFFLAMFIRLWVWFYDEVSDSE